MLDTLQDLPTTEQEDILLRITDWLLPHPGVGTAREPLTERDRAVLREATASLGLAPVDLGQRIPPSLIDLVGQELDRVVLPPDRALAAKQRLGDRGELAVDQYRLSFDDEDFYRQTWERLGVSRRQAGEAVLHADRVEHQRPDFPPGADAQQLSVFETFDADVAGTPDQSRILVTAVRTGDALKIVSAFRAYDDDDNVAASQRPFDTLDAFTKACGVPVILGGGPAKLLYWAERVEGVREDPEGSTMMVEVGHDSYNIVPQYACRLRDGGLDVAIAFAVSVDRYADSLRRHGLEPLDVSHAGNAG